MIKKLKIFSVVIFVSLLYCGILGIVFNSVSSVPVLSVNISNGVDMPIIMYHSVLKDTNLSGKYIVTPDTLKNDINFLKNKGYTFVSAQELIDYTNGTSKLPDKPVMLTFDDGFYNNYGYVMPILSEYDAKAVISVVGSYTDEYSKSNIANMTYGYVRWSVLKSAITPTIFIQIITAETVQSVTAAKAKIHTRIYLLPTHKKPKTDL